MTHEICAETEARPRKPAGARDRQQGELAGQDCDRRLAELEQQNKQAMNFVRSADSNGHRRGSRPDYSQPSV